MEKLYQIALPRKVVAGRGATAQIKDIVDRLKVENILLLVDGGVYKSGIVAPIEEMLRDYQVLVVDDTPPEPEYKQVLEIYEKIEDTRIELVLAVGGGSVMDTAKILAVMAKNPEYRDNLLDASLIAVRGLPTIFVPTTAGTGSEGTPNAIVVVPEKELKVGIVHEYFIPDVVILDPEMTRSLPPAVTAATGLDAFCHAIECFISKKANAFSDLYALKAINLIMKYLRRAYENGEDMEARENMLLAAFYGGLSIASSSTVAVHALSYPLGGKYRIPHGISNAILLPYVMEYNADQVLDKFREVAVAMELDIAGKDDEGIGKMVVQEIFQLTRDLNIPNDLKQYGIDEGDLEVLTNSAAEVTRLLNNNPKEMTKEDIRDVYLKLLEA